MLLQWFKCRAGALIAAEKNKPTAATSALGDGGEKAAASTATDNPACGETDMAVSSRTTATEMGASPKANLA